MPLLLTAIKAQVVRRHMSNVDGDNMLAIDYPHLIYFHIDLPVATLDFSIATGKCSNILEVLDWEQLVDWTFCNHISLLYIFIIIMYMGGISVFLNFTSHVIWWHVTRRLSSVLGPSCGGRVSLVRLLSSLQCLNWWISYEHCNWMRNIVRNNYPVHKPIVLMSEWVDATYPGKKSELITFKTPWIQLYKMKDCIL